MLKAEYPYKGRTDRIRHYSDAGMMIEQFKKGKRGKVTPTGNKYEEAIDVYPTVYSYEETDEPIPHIEPDEEVSLDEGEDIT